MKKKTLYYVMILSLLVLIVGGYYGVKAWNGRNLGNETLIKNHSYYTLRGSATAYQKNLYDELVSFLGQEERDEEKIAGSLVQNYVADYYTWTNKQRYNDISAVQFVNASIRTDFYQASLDTFYNDLGYYINQGTHQESLEVTQIDVLNVEKIDFAFGAELRPSYLVHVTWTYKESTVLDTSKYQHEGFFVVSEDEDTLFSILEAKTTWDK